MMIMAKIAKNLTELIGGTPLMKLAGYSRKYGLQQDIVAKLESFNPAGSVKDRVGLAMIEDAEARGVLKPGATIIEPTSGNTGVGLAMVATIKGYHLMLTMPETMSIERRNLLKALGAEIVLTDGMAGMAGSIAKAKELRDRIPGAVILQQFENPSNAKAHELTTGEEIWRDTDGQVDVFVAGVGTGGTVCGAARALKKHNPDIYIVAVEPASSPVLEGGEAAPHRIQGIGANFVPALYDASVVYSYLPVPKWSAASLAARSLVMWFISISTPMVCFFRFSICLSVLAFIVFSSLLKSYVGIPIRLGQHPASAQGIRNFGFFPVSL